MKLVPYLLSALDAPLAIVRRQVIAIAICVTCTMGVIYLCASAGLLALEPFTGAVGARLAVAGVLLAVGLIAIVTPRFFRKEGFAARAKKQSDHLPRDQKIAMIVEAVMLGLSIASPPARRSRSK